MDILGLCDMDVATIRQTVLVKKIYISDTEKSNMSNHIVPTRSIVPRRKGDYYGKRTSQNL